MKFQLIGLLSALALLTSCSKAPEAEQAQHIWKGSYEEVMAIYDNQFVYCTDDSDCPGFVAKLAFHSSANFEYTAGVCSGTLVDGQYIITNEHCIPAELHEGDSCGGQIKAIFPSTDEYEKEEAECAKVEKILSRNLDIDIAVIKLNRIVERGPTPAMNPDSLQEGDMITAYTMDPFFGGSMGFIKKKTCEISLQNVFSVYKNSKNKKLYMDGEDCEIIGGNSGTSMLDSNGNIVGVIHSGLDSESIYERGQDKYNFTSSIVETQIAMGANISCLVSPENSCINNSQDMAFYIDDLKRSLDREFASNDDFSYEIGEKYKLRLTYNESSKSPKEKLTVLIDSFKSDFRMTLNSIFTK